jgi:hypothetical protein
VLIVETLTTSPLGIDIIYLNLMICLLSLVMQLFLQKMICVMAITKSECEREMNGKQPSKPSLGYMSSWLCLLV